MSEQDGYRTEAGRQLTAEDAKSLNYYTHVINDLNEAFHHNYHQVIQRSHESLGQHDTPVIIVSADHVTLFHNSQRETITIIPDLYQQVKSISHVSFGIYVTLANNGFGPLAESIRDDLVFQLDLIEQGLSILDQLNIPVEFLALQRDTLNLAAKIVRDVLEKNLIEENQVLQFGLASAPLYLDNAALAARLELDELHRVVGGWKARMGPDNWENVYVVICAAHQARYRETTKQYFHCLFHEPEGLGVKFENRVIYAEHIHDIDAALQLLARHLADQRTSIALFGDRMRLQEDLMSDGAADYLKILLAD